MSYKDSVKSIESYYKNNFEDIYNIPTAYENIRFDDNVTEFIRLSIFFYDSSQITINRDHPDKRIPGEITFQIFTEPYKGKLRGLEISDNLISVFARKQISNNILTRTEKLDIKGIEPDKGLFQINIDIPFQIDVRL